MIIAGTQDEVIIKIRTDGTVVVENCVDGIKSFKEITPDALINCINKSVMRGGITSGLLPRGCLSYAEYDNGNRRVALVHPEDRADVSYVRSAYKNFPLPRLVFGFTISHEGRVSDCRLGVVGNESYLKLSTPMFAYPFSNVSGTHLCIGNNPLPRVQSLHTLSNLPYLILSMDNNNHSFNANNNKPCLEMRDLMELLKDKDQSYYYEHILKPSGKTLGDFIAGGR